MVTLRNAKYKVLVSNGFDEVGDIIEWSQEHQMWGVRYKNDKYWKYLVSSFNHDPTKHLELRPIGDLSGINTSDLKEKLIPLIKDRLVEVGQMPVLMEGFYLGLNYKKL